MTIIKPISWYWILYICAWLGCKNKQEQLRSEVDHSKAYSYLSSARFNGNFSEGCIGLSNEQLVRRVRDSVIPIYQAQACEMSFYMNPNRLSDSAQIGFIILCEKTFPKDDKIQAFRQLIRGELCMKRAQYDSALHHFQNCYEISMRAKRFVRATDAQYEMARLAFRRHQYPEAIRLYSEVNEVYTALVPNDGGRFFESAMKLAQTYRAVQDFDKAYEWHQKVWQYAAPLPWKGACGFKILAADALAEDHLHFHRWRDAKRMIDTAFYYQRLCNNPYEEAKRYTILAQIENALGQKDSAFYHFKVAHQRHIKGEDESLNAYFDQQLADGYYEIQALDSARWYYQRAKRTSDTVQKSVIHERLAQIFAQQQDFKRAFEHQLESQRWHKRVFTSDKDKAIGRVQAENDFKSALEQLQHRQQLLVLSIGVIILILLLFALVGRFWYVRQRQRHLLMEQANLLLEQEKQLLEQEKQLLTAQELIKNQALKHAEQELALKELALQNEQEHKNIALQQVHQERQDKERAETALYASSELLEMRNNLIRALELELKNMEQVPNASEKLPQMKILTNSDWTRFRNLFEERFPRFLDKLKSHFPTLTPAETRLFLLVKMGFDAVQISEMLGIAQKSVYINRYRLRKKLQLDEATDLEQFTQTFEG